MDENQPECNALSLSDLSDTRPSYYDAFPPTQESIAEEDESNAMDGDDDEDADVDPRPRRSGDHLLRYGRAGGGGGDGSSSALEQQQRWARYARAAEHLLRYNRAQAAGEHLLRFNKREPQTPRRMSRSDVDHMLR